MLYYMYVHVCHPIPLGNLSKFENEGGKYEYSYYVKYEPDILQLFLLSSSKGDKQADIWIHEGTEILQERIKWKTPPTHINLRMKAYVLVNMRK